MALSEETIFRRSRPGVKVRRLRLPRHHQNHDRAKPIPAIFQLPAELRLAIWKLVVAPDLPNLPSKKTSQSERQTCFGYVEGSPPPAPMPPADLDDDTRELEILDPPFPDAELEQPWPEPKQSPDSHLAGPHDRLPALEFAQVRPPPLIMVCKQMAREVLPIVFDNRRWAFDCPAQFDTSVHLPYLKPSRGIPIEQRQNPILSDADFEKSQAFVMQKLELLTKSINDSDMGRGATAFPFEERTYNQKMVAQAYRNPFDPPKYAVKDLSDFPLAERLPWGTFSWIRTVEALPIELKYLRFLVHFDAHISNVGPSELKVDISFVDRPERKRGKKSKSNRSGPSSTSTAGFSGRKVSVEWEGIDAYERLRPYMQELQCLLDETVRIISNRKHFRGFTLLEVEILASVFQFEAWECEVEGCWYCRRGGVREVLPPEFPFDDPFAGLDLVAMPPMPPPPVHDGQNVVVVREDEDEGEDDREGYLDNRRRRRSSVSNRSHKERELDTWAGRRRARSREREREEARARRRSTGYSSSRRRSSSQSAVFSWDLDRLQQQLGDLEQYP